MEELEIGQEMEYLYWMETWATIKRTAEGYELYFVDGNSSKGPLKLGVFESLDEAKKYYDGN